MLEMVSIGFLAILNFKAMSLILGGVVLGLIFGAIPGLTATMAIVLCLPLTYGMSPIDGMACFMGIYIGGITGGLIPAILINVPGTPASVATCFEGYPMMKKGQGAKALGLGVVASFMGGLFSILVLILVSPSLASLALKFGPYEYFAIAIFSLTMVSSLSGDFLIKGFLGALLGASLSMVGTFPIDSFPRFTFGFEALSAGLNLLPVLIGLFAVSEILFAAESKKTKDLGKIESPVIKGLGITWKDLSLQKWNYFRSSIIGTGIGILPGIGSSTSNLLSYAIAKNQSKHKENYGKGEPEGIVASETANNASIGGALVPLVTLGIPGDTVTAILIGGLMIHGLTPGPLLFTQHGEIVYSIFASLLVANCVMVAVFYLGIKWFIKILKIPKYILFPVIIVLCIVGAYGVNNRGFDIISTLAFGILGYGLQKFKIPLPPFILGFILWPIAEVSLLRGLMYSKGDFTPFVTAPIALAFLLAAALSVLLTIRKSLKRRRADLTS